jgi:hypothetical protein
VGWVDPARDRRTSVGITAAVSAGSPPATRATRPYEHERARAVARFQLGDDPETVAEASALDVEEVAPLEVDIIEHGSRRDACRHDRR